MKEIIVNKESFIKKLKTSRIFYKLKEDEIKDIIFLGKIIEYEKDEIIINENDMDPNMYIIIKGAVSIFTKQKCDDNTIKDVYISTISEGDIIGEAAIFLNAKRTAHVISLLKLTVLKLERKSYISLLTVILQLESKYIMSIIYFYSS